jgi:hypothetical protein
MTWAVVAVLTLDVAIVGALAFLMIHAARWGSHDRPDPFVAWYKHTREAFPRWHAAQAAVARVDAGVEAIENALLGAPSEEQQVQIS